MRASVWSRLRWDASDDALVNSRDAATMARTLLYLYGAGGILVLLTLLLPHGSGYHPLGLVLPAVAALVVSALLAWRFDRTSEWVFPLLPLMGAVLASVVVWSAGPDDVVVYSGFYFWVALATFSFFSFRICLITLVSIGSAYAVILVATPDVTRPVLRWVVLLATLSVAAVLIALLRTRIEILVRRQRTRMANQERVVALGRAAVAGADMAELSRLAAEAVAESLDVENVAILQMAGDDAELLVVAGTGGRAGRPGQAAIARSDPLIQPVLESEVAVTVDADGAGLASLTGERHDDGGGAGTAIGAAIPGRGEPLGALVAYSSGQRAFNRSDAALLEAITHVLGDAIERHRADEAARHNALHDPLTDRPNRVLFTDRLNQALIRQEPGKAVVGVFILEIDDLKRINDVFGHAAGDELLKALGPRLREALVLSDTVARFDGVAFAILCEGLRGENDALQVAERIRGCLGKPFELAGAPHRVGATIGIALSRADIGAEELIAEAETAVYRAIERSRGSFEFFDRGMRDRLHRRLEFERALREATELGQLRLAAQPIVSLPDFRPVGTELLLRWRHPRLGAVSPGEFIPVAEQSGAIIPIGRWVLERAFGLAASFRSHPQARLLLPLHVNISMRQLAHPEFVGTIDELLTRSGSAVPDLALEITEHALLSDADATVDTLTELRGMGFSIVLDDFGTGYSSLSHLKQLPLDRVKIDRMFIANLIQEAEDEAIVTSVIGMARAFGLHVIAEGVETREQAQRLAELGCWHAQGFLFSEPVPPDELVSGTMIGPGQSVSFRPTALSASRLDS